MGNNTPSNTKRIAKNTLVLYVRMIVVLLITLYTSRIVLKALGVEDFGLYSVVGGVVGLLTFLKGTMLKSTQRFLNVAMVKGDESLSGIFASSITVHLMFVGLFLLLGETVGLWFLNAKIHIPEGRELAANVVYQASLISLCISIISTPYSAAVVAYEKMGFLAVVGIIDAVLKLGIALFLLVSNSDRMILYGLLLMCISGLDFLAYFFYCRKKQPLLKFRLSFDRNNLKQIFGFVTWTIVGQFAVVGCNQGNVVLVNLFHSLVANAAMSVGNQINHAVTNLTTNFQTAFNPQITKSFAEGNHNYLCKLVNSTSKLSFCIMFIVALPVAFNIDLVLDLWLETVPELSNTFAILFMVNAIINAIGQPYNFTVLSSDSIRNFQIATAFCFLMDLPVTYVLFKLGMPPTTVLWVKIGVITLILFVRIYFASKVVSSLNVKMVSRKVLLPIIITSAVPITLAILLNGIAANVGIRLVYTVVIEIVSVIMIWFVCFEGSERQMVLDIIKKNKTKKNK